MARIATVIGFLLCTVAAPALAATVGNCSDEAESVLANIGGEVREYLIYPGQKRVIPGPVVRLQIHDHEPITALHNEHYCIWHGKLLIQRRMQRSRPR